MTPSTQDFANAIRVLSMDAVEKAQSGHPGAPLGMAEIAVALYTKHLSHNPSNPQWFNRDRVVLSNGHGCMLLYAILHLTGYALTLADIQAFRQLHSQTPGHPERGHTPGVEVTTGPLGQGFAASVGLALSEKHLAAAYNQPSHELIDHYTYCFVGDGCLMEGISQEAASMAGHHQLGKLIVLFDDNGISIDGAVSGWVSEDITKRFEALAWEVLSVDGHSVDAVSDAIGKAKANTQQPTLIRCRTTIGQMAPTLQGTAKSHGAPLGATEVAAIREAIEWSNAPFEVPEAIYQAMSAKEVGHTLEKNWQNQFADYSKAHPELAKTLLAAIQGQLPTTLPSIFESGFETAITANAKVATRKASKGVLDKLMPAVPSLIGGSADLTGSNLTLADDTTLWSKEDASGRYLQYGVREFGMAAIMNGMACHGGLIPFAGTFLVFSDYCRNAIRLAAMMRCQVIYVLTHDSIGLGEDGPTHQPIEHLTMLRATPNCEVWRPADAAETWVAWEAAMLRNQGPTVLALSRQGLPALPVASDSSLSAHRQAIAKGGYVCQSQANAVLTLVASGSEVSLALETSQCLAAQGILCNVVSMPSLQAFMRLSKAEQTAILGQTPRVLIEAGHPMTWQPLMTDNTLCIGIEEFGASAPANVLMSEYGLTAEAITVKVTAWLPTL